MELLDIVDSRGEPTGQVVDRETAHREGLLHRTAHVWLLRERAGQIEVLLQKRSACKDSHPGCYDISSAGHIPAGVDYVPSALRELQEELGVTASASDLILCGQRAVRCDEVFHGRPFHDRQITRVYALWMDPPAFVLQESEVSEVRWMPYDACLRALKDPAFLHCIVEDELRMLRKTFPDGNH